MKRVVCALLAVAVMAVPAMAELTHQVDRSNTPIITAEAVAPLGGSIGPRATAVYDSLYAGAAGYWTFGSALGPVGYDDYDTISGVNLTAVRFVGGVTAPGGIVWFEFYTDLTSPMFVTSLGVQLPSSGWWIWTINVSNPPFVIPHTGLLQVVANSTFTGGGGTYPNTIAGAWFFTSSDAVVAGSNILGYGSPPMITTTGGTYYGVHDFAFMIPEPATLSLFGAGLLLVMRRRR